MPELGDRGGGGTICGMSVAGDVVEDVRGQKRLTGGNRKRREEVSVAGVTALLPVLPLLLDAWSCVFEAPFASVVVLLMRLLMPLCDSLSVCPFRYGITTTNITLSNKSSPKHPEAVDGKRCKVC